MQARQTGEQPQAPWELRHTASTVEDPDLLGGHSRGWEEGGASLCSGADRTGWESASGVGG